MEKGNYEAGSKTGGICRIAVTGPESTGKSTLSADLANYFGTCWVEEYAREFLEQLGRPYEQADLKRIAEGQLRAEEKKAALANRFLICDTDLTVVKIWSEFKYGDCDPEIVSQMNAHPYDLYFLTYIDLPWEDDPLRENPHEREELFGLYEQELKSRRLPYVILKGNREERLQQAVKEIQRRFL